VTTYLHFVPTLQMREDVAQYRFTATCLIKCRENVPLPHFLSAVSVDARQWLNCSIVPLAWYARTNTTNLYTPLFIKSRNVECNNVKATDRPLVARCILS
jgi:hypothetical protein